MMKDTFKNVLSFEFWQKFGKAFDGGYRCYAGCWFDDFNR